MAFCQVQRTFVFGAHCAVEEVCVAQAHLGGDVSEQGHQRLQRDSGVDRAVQVCRKLALTAISTVRKPKPGSSPAESQPN